MKLKNVKMRSVAKYRGILLDFYGTLARATHWFSLEQALAEHGYVIDPEIRDRWFNDGIDGDDHEAASQSRDHYVKWQLERTYSMLSESDVHPDEHATIAEKLRIGAATRVLEAYDEVPGVLAQLRADGLKLVVCSNWDWDLAEAVEESGLTDAVDLLVSSAWVGVRKPNPRIYSHTLAKAGLEPEDVLFVGDTWGADVEGPLAAGMTPMYLRREGHWADATCPHDEPRGRGVTVAPDLSSILNLI